MFTFYEKLQEEGEDRSTESMLQVVSTASLEEVRQIEVPADWVAWG